MSKAAARGGETSSGVRVRNARQAPDRNQGRGVGDHARYFYDAEGNVTDEDRTWQAGALAIPERGEAYRHGAFGRVTAVFNADNWGTGEGASQTQTVYDNRGNPQKLKLVRPGGDPTGVAVGHAVRHGGERGASRTRGAMSTAAARVGETSSGVRVRNARQAPDRDQGRGVGGECRRVSRTRATVCCAPSMCRFVS
jgi:hypothetical protein